MLPGFGTDDVAANDDNMRRQRQQRMFQTGLLICFLLLLMDPGPKTNESGETDHSPTPPGLPLRDSLKAILLNAPLPDEDTIYAQNVTGYYKGEWGIINSTESIIAKAGHNSKDNVTNVSMLNSNGNVVFQLTSQPLFGLEEEVSMVQGLVKLVDGVSDSLNDATYNVQGVFLHRFGRMVAIASTGSSQIKLVWPIQQDHNATLPINVDITTDNTLSVESGNRELQIAISNKFHQTEMYHKFELENKNSENQSFMQFIEEKKSNIFSFMGFKEANSHIFQEGLRYLVDGSEEYNVEGNFYALDPLPVVVEPFDLLILPNQTSMVIPTKAFPISTRSNSNGRNCLFSMDFQANTRNELDGINSNSDSYQNPIWVSSLYGNWVGMNCEFSATISATAIRTNWEKAYPKAVNYSVVMTLVSLLQIGLLFRQLYHSNTQASASRVSLLCVGHQAILDALICIAHLLLCAIMQPLFFPLVSVAFFKLVNFCIFEMRFLILVYQSRQPQSFLEVGWHAMRNELAVLHGRFYLALFSCLAFVWLLYQQMAFLMFILYSFWIPQIVSNARRNNRNSLHPVYLIGMSLSRLVLPLYVYGCPHSFMSVVASSFKPMYQECALLIAWVTFQVLVILAQDLLGPHFFIPRRLLPQKYNYYRPVPHGPLFEEIGASREGDIESGNSVECAICYNVVDPLQENHMVTPCDHCFHSECLQQWIDIKMECPTCRAALPPT